MIRKLLCRLGFHAPILLGYPSVDELGFTRRANYEVMCARCGRACSW